MIYSPKHNIQVFIETKNQQIKALKDKIAGSSISLEQMHAAKDQLNVLKASCIALEREDNQELRDLVQTTHAAIEDLVERKNALMDQLHLKKKDQKEMEQIKHELQHKEERSETLYKEVLEAKSRLEERKNRKNQQILQFQEDNEIQRKEIELEKKLSQQLQVAKEDLKSKVLKVKRELNDKKQNHQNLKEQLAKKSDQVDKLEHSISTDCLKKQNLMLKINNEERQKENYFQKIESAQSFLQRAAEDKLVLQKQCQTSSNVEHLINMVNASSLNRQREHNECQQIINETQEQIVRTNSKKEQLQGKVNRKKQYLKQLKEKGAQLKNILNSIFHEDSGVLKILADKKVYDQKENQKEHQERKMKKNISAFGVMDQSKLFAADMSTCENFFMKSN